jgi:hypothetical protein
MHSDGEGWYVSTTELAHPWGPNAAVAVAAEETQLWPRGPKPAPTSTDGNVCVKSNTVNHTQKAYVSAETQLYGLADRHTTVMTG